MRLRHCCRLAYKSVARNTLQIVELKAPCNGYALATAYGTDKIQDTDERGRAKVACTMNVWTTTNKRTRKRFWIILLQCKNACILYIVYFGECESIHESTFHQEHKTSKTNGLQQLCTMALQMRCVHSCAFMQNYRLDHAHDKLDRFVLSGEFRYRSCPLLQANIEWPLCVNVSLGVFVCVCVYLQCLLTAQPTQWL